MKPARRVLIVLGHGRSESLCHHLTAVARATLEERGVEVRLHDLLADGFDPLLRLAPEERHATPPAAADDPLVHRYCEDVRWAEGLVVVHPVWWFAPPAILKGWIDRVFVHGVAVNQPEQGPPEGILQGRRALVVQTFNAPRAVDTLFMRNLSEAFWKRAVFTSVGVRDVKRLAFYGVEGISADDLATAERRLRRAVLALAG
jgi:putative NADPH-quinone reductase